MKSKKSGDLAAAADAVEASIERAQAAGVVGIGEALWRKADLNDIKAEAERAAKTTEKDSP